MIPAYIFIAAIAGLIFLYLLWNYSYWCRKGVPQENPLKLFGDIDFTLTRKSYLDMYQATYAKHKKYPFQGVYQIFKPCLFLCDPLLIKDVMLNKAKVFPDTGSRLDEETEPILAGDPFFQTGQKWKDGRARFSTLGTPARLRGLLPYILESCSSMEEYIRNLRHETGKGDGSDAKDIVSRCVTENLVAVLLGGKANSFSKEESIFQEIGKAVFEDNLKQNLAMLTIIGAPHIAKFLKLRIVPDKTTDLLSRLIKEEAQRRKQCGITRNDLFDFLLKKNQNGESGEINYKSIISTIVTFYIEGFESSALVGAFALLNLAKNPEVQEKLRQEILQKSPPGTNLTEEAVEVQFLSNCILETMRITPPVTILQRKTEDDFTLKASTGEEVHLNKGTNVLVPIYGLHNDPRAFPEPQVFDPDRFNDPEQRRFFIGFGDGPRLCLGQRYAQLALSVMIASIIRNFKVEIGSKMQLPVKYASHPFFLLPANGVWLRFVPL